MANHQRDRYMAPHGVMYLVTYELDLVGPLGERMHKVKSTLDKEKIPPIVDPSELRLINSLRAQEY